MSVEPASFRFDSSLILDHAPFTVICSRINPLAIQNKSPPEGCYCSVRWMSSIWGLEKKPKNWPIQVKMPKKSIVWLIFPIESAINEAFSSGSTRFHPVPHLPHGKPRSIGHNPSSCIPINFHDIIIKLPLNSHEISMKYPLNIH